MLYLVGLGLGDAKDITVKGLEIIKRCDRVYLEAYTSILTCGKEELEQFYGREVILADREQVEQGAEEIITEASTQEVALLVVGDPFGATTHVDVVARAEDRGVTVQVIHNASILNAVGCIGLQLYSYGETVSIPFWLNDWQPESFYEKASANKERGLHTLCLLDIKVKEQTVENMMKGRKIYEPPRFMTCQQAASQLLDIAERQTSEVAIDGDSLCVGVARVGSSRQLVKVARLKEFAEEGKIDLGGPLHSLVIPGRLHPLEEDALRRYQDFNGD